MSLHSITLKESKTPNKILVVEDYSETENEYAFDLDKGIEHSIMMGKAARLESVKVSIGVLEKLLSR